jgi:hypothetical protein
MKMEETECSETSVYKIQTPRNYPEESTQYFINVYQIDIKTNMVCQSVRSAFVKDMKQQLGT